MIIDFHAHILPGLDHGCKDVASAMIQLQQAKRAGIDLIVATSHFYPHVETVDSFLKRRKSAWEKLRNVLSLDLPHIVLGAETLVCDGMENMERLTMLAFEGTEVILVEMPSGVWRTSLYKTVERINAICNGSAVLAHVDRYDEDSIEKLFDMGIRGQINAENLCKLRYRKRLMRWVEQRNIVALGSDLHGTADGYKKFIKSQKILGNDFVQIMKFSEKLLVSVKRPAP
jgi:protein-tyrosine phosphatase